MPTDETLDRYLRDVATLPAWRGRGVYPPGLAPEGRGTGEGEVRSASPLIDGLPLTP